MITYCRWVHWAITRVTSPVGGTRRLSRGSSSGTSPQRYILAFRYILYFFFYIYSLVNLVVFVRVLGTCYGKETSRFCQAQNFEASFFCTAHFITSACSFNIGLALLLGIRSLDPRPRARTAPALA